VEGEIDGLYSLTNDRADEPYIYLHLEQKNILHFGIHADVLSEIVVPRHTEMNTSL
jgi:hypothetical protein